MNKIVAAEKRKARGPRAIEVSKDFKGVHHYVHERHRLPRKVVRSHGKKCLHFGVKNIGSYNFINFLNM